MEVIKKEEKVGSEEEEKRLIEEIAVLDFDVLCSTVAMQSRGKWRLMENDNADIDVVDGGGEGVGGSVFRLWEGEVLDCFDDRRIAIESVCCPCYRFGKNMGRAGLGPCFVQGTLHFLLATFAFLNCIAFAVTRRRCFLYLAVAFTISVAMYLGFFRTQMRKKFNIRGSDSFVDDCIYHLICPCCTMCQESRTLEMNNVQGGTWHGRGETICIGGNVTKGRKTFVELQPPLPISAQLHEPSSLPQVDGTTTDKGLSEGDLC